jgi:hypothetical protein
VAAVKSGRWPFRVVLAFPHPEIEAWPIAVFEPRTKGEHARIRKQERQLGYSPVEEPERLTSTVSDGIADAKSVRDAIVADDGGGDWLEIDLEVLRDRGRTCGLTDFLREVEAVVVPLLAGGAEKEGAGAEDQ